MHVAMPGRNELEREEDKVGRQWRAGRDIVVKRPLSTKQRHVRKSCEVRIAGEQSCTPVPRCRVDDGIGSGEFVFAVQVCGQQGDVCVQGYDDAFLRVRDHLVSLFFPKFAHQPLRKLELHDGRYDTLRFVGELFA